ncbi:MAG: class I SAM-dependent methyltransferase [Desulfohalobiaceae bacterium]|nr:class I SAM-dependent methyltransferase [Desulfohalobiaceae bacterium]
MQEDAEQITRQRIESWIDLSGKQVLEVGCGNGRVTAMLADRVGSLVGVDPDQDQVAEARARLPEMDLRVGSGERLDFPEQSFDLVLFTFSLHHQDSRQALEEGRRVLRKKGWLLAVEPALDGEVQLLSNLFHDESPALIYTRQAVKNCSLLLEDTDVFHTRWLFQDREELYAYHFAFYQRDFDPETVRQIDAFLGAKVESRPLILKDKLVMYCLQKP